MRDSKDRFKSKELLLPLPSTTMVLNILFLIFILLPWLYVGFKFNITEKINTLLNSLFFDYSKCEYIKTYLNFIFFKIIFYFCLSYVLRLK